MKRSLFLLLLLVGALSCTDSHKEEAVPVAMSVSANSLTIDGEPDGDLPSFGVTIGGEDYTQYSFEVGDKIRIYSEKGLNVVMEAENAGVQGIKFKGNFQPVAEVDTYYAVYPEYLEVEAYDGEMRVNLRSLRQDGTATNAAVLAAMSENVRGEGVHFDFRPINTILYVRADNPGIPFTAVRFVTFPAHPRAFPPTYTYNFHTGTHEHVKESLIENHGDFSLDNLAPDLVEGCFVSLPPQNFARLENPHLSADLQIHVTTQDGAHVNKSLDAPNLKLGYSYSTTMQMPESCLYSITPIEVGYTEVDAYVRYAVLDDIRCLIVPNLGEELTPRMAYELGEPINGGQESDTRSAAHSLHLHRFTGLNSGVNYMMYAAARIEGESGDEYISVKQEVVTLVEEGEMELTVFTPGASWVSAGVKCIGYDEVRYLITENGLLSDPKEVFEMGEDTGLNYGAYDYDYYRLEKEDLTPLTRYTVYVVGKFEKSGAYHMEKGSTVTLPLSLRVSVNKVTEDYIWARADFEGYEEVKFYLSEDAGITDAKWILEHGEVPSGASSSGIKTHYFQDVQLAYDKTYTIYCAASYKDEYYEIATTQVKTAGLDPKVYCGAMSSYSYYKEGKLPTANEMCNTAIAIADLFVGSDKSTWPAYAYSTYEGIWDKDIASAGVVVYVPGTSNYILDVPLTFYQGYIGYGDSTSITYEQLDWGTYAVKAYIKIKDGPTFFSDEKILHVTGIPYDSRNGECHGFYTLDSWAQNLSEGGYTENQLKFFWEECSTGDKSSVMGWVGHDGVMLQPLRTPHWPQILSPKFYIPEPFTVKGYMKGFQAAGIDPVTLSLSQSTEHAGDYSENGEQVHMVRLDLHFLKRSSATSGPVVMTKDYPCFQIEHESALPLPHTLVEDLRIFYAE